MTDGVQILDKGLIKTQETQVVEKAVNCKLDPLYFSSWVTVTMAPACQLLGVSSEKHENDHHQTRFAHAVFMLL